MGTPEGWEPWKDGMPGRIGSPEGWEARKDGKPHSTLITLHIYSIISLQYHITVALRHILSGLIRFLILFFFVKINIFCEIVCLWLSEGVLIHISSLPSPDLHMIITRLGPRPELDKKLQLQRFHDSGNIYWN